MTRRLSYAQNGEDVVLHRALSHVDAVTYCDVGAGHPVVGSTSRALHELGWRGIHVEPVPAYAHALHEQRPDDVVVEGAAAREEGTRPFWFVPDTGLSTSSEAEAERARRRGWEVHESAVEVRRLSDLLDEHLGGRDLHALKVDVGGAELDVLEGAELERHRPWVVVVRATRGDSSERTHAAWEPRLTALGYTPALFDGLNQWYVSPDHPELGEPLSYPACSLDPWVRVGLGFPDPPTGEPKQVLSAAALQLVVAVSGQKAAEARTAEVHALNTKLRADLAQQGKDLDALRAAARSHAAKTAELERAAAREKAARQAIERSPYWRMTAPARKLVAVLKRGGRGRG